MIYNGADPNLYDDFKTSRGRRGYASVRNDEQDRIMEDLKRDWDRHPELRSQYGGSFEKYLRSQKNNVTFG